MYGYVYLILNNIDGKTYIGKRKLRTSKLWNEDGYMGSGIHLKNAQKKYGVENFEKFLICYTDSEKDACEKEKYWIAEYRSRGKAEYNIANGGDGGRTIFSPHSVEWNNKISLSKKGKCFSEESKKKMSNSQLGNKNAAGKRSEEVCKKLSESHKGQVAWNKGKKMSDDFKQKCRNRQLVKRMSEETKNK